MNAIRLDLAYDGTDFHGWAKQPGVRTIEGEIEQSLARMLGEPPKLSVAGRTDAGVHAEGQVASFEAPEHVDPERVQRMLNGLLAPEVVVIRVSRAADGFDARHSATAREYLYRIATGPVPSPFTARYTWHRPGRLALGRMRAAARLLQGEHDFSSFSRAADTPASPVRTLKRLVANASGEWLEFRAVANAFLHQMVRSLVGTLVVVGEGRIEPDSIPEIMEARDRASAGPVAPPHGLTLFRVIYGRR